MEECCRQPFTALEIAANGEVYTCCPSFINKYKIGNIFEADAKKIWYSNEAQLLRKKVLSGDYSLCNLEICRQYKPKNIKCHKFNVKPKFPLYVTLSYDRACNLSCITCRDEKIRNVDDGLEKKSNKIIKVLLKLLDNAELLALSGGGEALYSRHSRELIKKIAKINKKLLFNINTNGILFNENNLMELGILGRINEVFVSLPALNKDLYEKIMLGSNLDVVLNNIKWMAQARDNKKINRVTLNCVISKLNYKEIPSLVQFAKDLGLVVTLSPFDDWGTHFAKNYDWEVWNENNSDYENFVKVLNNMPEYDKMIVPKLFKELIKDKKKGTF